MAPSRPSRRSIRAGTAGYRVATKERETSMQPRASGMHAVNRRVLSVNPQHVITPIDVGDIRDKVGAELRAGKNFNYKTASQIKSEAERGALAAFGSRSSSKYKREVAYQIRVNTRSQNIRVAAEIEGRLPSAVRAAETEALRKLRAKATAQEKKEREEDLARREEEKRKEGQRRIYFEGLKTNKRSLRQPSPDDQRQGGPTADQRRRGLTVNQMEAEARNEVSRDPNQASRFEKFLQGELIDDEEVKRQEALAKHSFDDYYTRQEGFVKAELSIKLKKLNETFNIFSKESSFFLEREIRDINQNVAEELLDAVNKAQKSGNLTSGILRATADRIVKERERDLEGVEMTAEFARQKAVLAQESGVGLAELSAEKEIDVQRREQETSEKDRFFENVEEFDARSKAAQEESATRIGEEGPEEIPGDPREIPGAPERISLTPGEFTPEELSFSQGQRRGQGRIRTGEVGIQTTLPVPRRFAGQLTAPTTVRRNVASPVRSSVSRPTPPTRRATTPAGIASQRRTATRRTARLSRR
jgi:hypothetical protein